MAFFSLLRCFHSLYRQKFNVFWCCFSCFPPQLCEKTPSFFLTSRHKFQHLLSNLDVDPVVMRGIGWQVDDDMKQELDGNRIGFVWLRCFFLRLSTYEIHHESKITTIWIRNTFCLWFCFFQAPVCLSKSKQGDKSWTSNSSHIGNKDLIFSWI